VERTRLRRQRAGAPSSLSALALLCALVGASTLACSDTPDGSGNGGGGTGQENCTGGFCLSQLIDIGAVPTSLTFPDVTAGTDIGLDLTIKHTGSSGTLSLDKAYFDIETPDFTLDNFKPTKLEVNGKLELKVHYKAAKAGAKSLNLVIENNASDTKKRKLLVPIKVAAGGGFLVINPDPVNFDSVPKGSTNDLDVSLNNTGTTVISVASVTVSGNQTEDFSVVEAPAKGTPIEPMGSISVKVRYAPTGANPDTGTLGVVLEDGREKKALVLGNAIEPEVNIIPGAVDFDWVSLGTQHTQELHIQNLGAAPLHVTGIEITNFPADHPPYTGVSLDSKGPFTIAPQADQTVKVSLDVQSGIPNDGNPIAILRVANDDSDEGTVDVGVYAKTATCTLVVQPDDIVDFTYVGKNVKATRTVMLFNQGQNPCKIAKAEITANPGKQYAFKGVFGPSSGQELVIDAQKSATFDVEFWAQSQPGAVKGELHLYSDDPSKPDWPLMLLATITEGATCKIQPAPPVLNFGVVGYGAKKALSMGFTNIGNGPCAFADKVVYPCVAPVPFPGFPPQPATCSTTGSGYFSTGPISAKLFNLGPGESGSILVQFNAPEDLGLFGDPNVLTPADGLLWVKFSDVASGGFVNVPPNVTSPADVSKAQPNLKANIGKTAVVVLPDSIDFGVITVGCKSKKGEINVFNTGTTEANITGVELQNCGPEVVFTDLPAIPKTGLPIKQSGPVTLKVQYGPQNTGVDNCQVVIHTDAGGGQDFSVPLQGQGTNESDQTDTWVQGSGKKVDVLFVVDNSGSMGDNQSVLSANVQTFVTIADLWKNDYQIGVTTTDIDKGGDKGKLAVMSGGYGPSDRIITPKTTPSPTGMFSKLAIQGEDGSGTERGFQAAQLALTTPLIFDAKKACTADTDCSAPSTCVVGPDGKKGCGGWNRGFLRKDAGLEVVILSDEEDQSDADITFYINFFYSIKGPANKNLFHLHAIVGNAQKGCTGAGNNSADAGDKYIEVANATGGKVGSICDSSFANVLKSIGNIAFGLTVQFFLSRTPDPDTITVTVDGQACQAGANSWSYDAATNSVTFVEGGSCMPKEGQTLSIHYETLCIP